MKLFLDSANLKDIETALERGFVHGITTNPSLLAKEPKSDFIKHIDMIIRLLEVDKRQLPLSVEVFAATSSEMIVQAKWIIDELAYGALNIKVPIGWDELKVIRMLNRKTIKVNCTCCFTEEQCIIAADAGASYVSIFYNRLKDIQGNPLSVIANVRNIFDKAGHKTEIIVGSIRNKEDILMSQLYGAHIVTASVKILEESAHHPGTDKSVEGFKKDFAEWIK